MRGNIWNFCYPRVRGVRPRLFYAHSPNVDEGDSTRGIPPPSNNDFLISVLINEEMSGNMTSYYERVQDSDLLARGNLILRRKRLLGEETRSRLGQLSLGDIFKTGLPQEDVGRYYFTFKVSKSRETPFKQIFAKFLAPCVF